MPESPELQLEEMLYLQCLEPPKMLHMALAPRLPRCCLCTLALLIRTDTGPSPLESQLASLL